MQYAFSLGRTPKLSRAEIFSACKKHKISYSLVKNDHEKLVISVDDQNNFSAQELISTLGGTKLISVLIENTSKNTSVEETIIQHLQKTQPEGKVTFSIEGAKQKRLGLRIKKELKQKYQRSVRYVEAKSLATIIHNNLIEKQSFYVIDNNNVYAGIAAPNLNRFVKRDEARIHNARRGMLPPRLAQMMLNISEAPNSSTIMDPFCGSGTVLTEAIAMGYQSLIGNDLSADAIADTEENIRRIAKLLDVDHTSLDIDLITGSAETLSTQNIHKEIQAIVTEPYLGKPLTGNETHAFLANQADELAKLYINSFKAFAKITQPGSTVVFAFPGFKSRDAIVSTAKKSIPTIVDTRQFATVPLLSEQTSCTYTRADQYLVREIWKFVRL